MLVAYDSMTGNVKPFIHKLNMPAVQIGEDLVIDEDFILITYTTRLGLSSLNNKLDDARDNSIFF